VVKNPGKDIFRPLKNTLEIGAPPKHRPLGNVFPPQRAPGYFYQKGVWAPLRNLNWGKYYRGISPKYPKV